MPDTWGEAIQGKPWIYGGQDTRPATTVYRHGYIHVLRQCCSTALPRRRTLQRPSAASGVIWHTIRMYPSVPGVNDPPRAYGYGVSNISSPQYPAAGAGGSSNLASASSLDASPWGTDSSSILRVKIAEDYKLDAPVGATLLLAVGAPCQPQV
jgi:hypothetical protein